MRANAPPTMTSAATTPTAIQSALAPPPCWGTGVADGGIVAPGAGCGVVVAVGVAGTGVGTAGGAGVGVGLGVAVAM